jgi:hypothetical protein
MMMRPHTVDLKNRIVAATEDRWCVSNPGSVKT